MSSLKELFSHSSIYFIGRLLTILAGFISMPILTRILPKEDYGIMSLVFLSLTFFGTIAAFGFPQATTRYFAEYKLNNDINGLRKFCSGMTIGSFFSGLAAMLLVISASYLLAFSNSFSDFAYYLRFASSLILIRVLAGVVMQIYRADKRPVFYSLIGIARRYLTVISVIVLVVYVFKNVKGVFLGTIVIEGLILFLCLAMLYKKKTIGFRVGSFDTVIRAVKFGLPLVIADLLTTIIASGDRFAIQYFLGAEPVANYSVVYDLSEYISTLFISPVRLAIMPIVYEIWARDGHEMTSRYVSKALKYMMVLIIPIIFGFSFLGEDIIVLMASEKYAGSGYMVSFVITGVMLASIHFIFFTGLLLREISSVLIFINLAGGAVNIILNIIMIPVYGIIGAAYATVVTYAVLIFITHLLSCRHLKIELDGWLISKALIVSIAMIYTLEGIGSISSSLIIDVLSKALCGSIFYATFMLIIDRDIRQLALQQIKSYIRT